ncbi:LytR family transcriptional regulator [Streptomyces spiroverticillatus]|uniref:LytR family transcriptional regulator n=1 Tax=Streptomyces finlayi TaxID=67296 RepID=A0A919CEZ9_9ACTN|nr:LCP family protein [Streptomyces finlayi]GHA41158.1 LytR family transcriptional regulator [Streptomyces spiroverticillatus]GHD16837.1 LytR family transcriptional regulator [Streptomyces finlayi]
MDAHSRGADEIDPADQWVLNPHTGNYELRLDNSAGSAQAGSAPAGSARNAGQPQGSPRGQAPRGRGGEGAPRRDVPAQRSRGGGSRGNTPRGDNTAPQAGRRKRKQPKKGNKRALKITGGVVGFVLVAGSAGAWALYNHFNGNLKSVEVSGGSGGFKKDQAINILVIGTDKRTGDGNSGYGDKNSPGHADTTILFHVSKDRTNATALSIPRDLKTRIPDCPTKLDDGSEKVVPGSTFERFNTSLGQSDRDPGCTMRTVKEITGLTVDHFMMVDFNAVKSLTTAVGGVDVCVAKDVNDKKSHLKLSKGKHTIQGEQALAFVRTRGAFGTGSDLSRIQTQQQFLGAMLRKMKSSETLTDLGKLYDLADAATKALTVDSGINGLGKLKSLATEVAQVDPKNITFTTLPVIDNPAEPPNQRATVVVDKPKAEALFSILQSDTSLTEVKKKEKAEKKDQQAALLKGEKAAAEDVRVDIFNGSGTGGAAQETLTWLQVEKGMKLATNGGNSPDPDTAKTVLTYGENQADQARALAAVMGLPGSALKPTGAQAGAREPMKLTLGKDFSGAGKPLGGPAKAPEGIQQANAGKSVCAQ